MLNRKNLTIGIILIVMGILFLLSNLNESFSWKNIWPVVFLIPIFFITMDFLSSPSTKKDKIFPLFFLTQLMIFFYIWSSVFHYHDMNKLWPFFILMPGISTVMLGIFKPKVSEILSGSIVVFIGILFLLYTFKTVTFSFLLNIWPVFLIILGLYIIFSIRRKNKKD
jgi:hypothetical protein